MHNHSGKIAAQLTVWLQLSLQTKVVSIILMQLSTGTGAQVWEGDLNKCPQAPNKSFLSLLKRKKKTKVELKKRPKEASSKGDL